MVVGNLCFTCMMHGESYYSKSLWEKLCSSIDSKETKRLICRGKRSWEASPSKKGSFSQSRYYLIKQSLVNFRGALPFGAVAIGRKNGLLESMDRIRARKSPIDWVKFSY